MSRYYGFGRENLPVPGDDIRQEPAVSPLMSIDEMGALLGLPRSNVYSILKSRQYGHLFDSRIVQEKEPEPDRE